MKKLVVSAFMEKGKVHLVLDGQALEMGFPNEVELDDHGACLAVVCGKPPRRAIHHQHLLTQVRRNATDQTARQRRKGLGGSGGLRGWGVGRLGKRGVKRLKSWKVKRLGRWDVGRLGGWGVGRLKC
jgi:hypothetical protein